MKGEEPDEHPLRTEAYLSCGISSVVCRFSLVLWERALSSFPTVRLIGGDTNEYHLAICRVPSALPVFPRWANRRHGPQCRRPQYDQLPRAEASRCGTVQRGSSEKS